MSMAGGDPVPIATGPVSVPPTLLTVTDGLDAKSPPAEAHATVPSLVVQLTPGEAQGFVRGSISRFMSLLLLVAVRVRNSRAEVTVAPIRFGIEKRRAARRSPFEL